MRVIITGGTGLIGSALAVELASAGHEVVILSRDTRKATAVPAGARVVSWDARTAKGWGDVADGAGAIVNLAGENIAAGRWSAERKRRIRESRLNAGHAVLEAVEAASTNPRAVIQASGIGIYGATGDVHVREGSPPGRGFLADLAVEWEASTVGVRRLGVRWAAIRTGVVLSTRGGALPRMMLPLPLMSPKRFGKGRQWFPWIHISDEVAAIRLLVEHEGAHGAFNLVSPHPVRNAEFLKQLNTLLRRPLAVPVPAALLRLALGEMATEVLDGQRASPLRLKMTGYRFRFPEVTAALYDLLRGPTRTD